VNPVREIVITRVRCPHCASDRRRVYGKREDPSGDTRRYCLCLDCGGKFHVVETDPVGMFNPVETHTKGAR
jgi:transcriptional regulator NrdR family protein